MNIAKNMEAIFIIAIALAGATSLATAAVPAAAAKFASQHVEAAPAGTMPTVVVHARRLSAAEKAAL